MLSSWSTGAFDITIREVDDPVIVEATDVIVDISYAAICGSDLWPYRGITARRAPGSTGHEFIGRVGEVGKAVTGLKVGDSVIAPFMYSDGICDECRRGLQSQCANGGLWGRDTAGAQAERIRVPYAETTLVKLPWAVDDIDVDLAKKLLPLADVFVTGYHGATLAGVQPGDVVVIVGDGAVGISAAYGAKLMKAGRVILLGEQQARLAIAHTFGVETIQVSRDQSGSKRFRELEPDLAVDRVVEAVGMQAAFDTALDIVRIGGGVGFIGVPHAVESIMPMRIFSKTIHLAGGAAPARHYIEHFVAETAVGRFDASPLINRVYPLSEIKEGYEAMNAGAALKVALTIP